MPFAELQQRYAHLPPNALQLLLSQLLERRRAEAPQPAARGLTSLLEPAALSVLGDGVPASGSEPAPATSQPAWLRPGRLLLSDPHRLLLLRQAGLLRSAQHPGAIQPPEAYARQLAHALTVRGHRFAVYCLAYDRTGRYLITGSDDRLVKVGCPGLARLAGGRRCHRDVRHSAGRGHWGFDAPPAPRHAHAPSQARRAPLAPPRRCGPPPPACCRRHVGVTTRRSPTWRSPPTTPCWPRPPWTAPCASGSCRWVQRGLSHQPCVQAQGPSRVCACR